MGRRGIWAVLFLLGCAGAQPRPESTARAESQNRFVSFDFGFEIERPPGKAWTFTDGKEAPEGIAIPVTVVHAATGSQVVVQVAPDVAPISEFAVRLANGLGENYGFVTTQPTRVAENRMEFLFSVEDRVLGRVGLRQERGKIFVLLGTWPKDAPERVVAEVYEIMESLRPVVVLEGSYASLSNSAGGGTPSSLARTCSVDLAIPSSLAAALRLPR